MKFTYQNLILNCILNLSLVFAAGCSAQAAVTAIAAAAAATSTMAINKSSAADSTQTTPAAPTEGTPPYGGAGGGGVSRFGRARNGTRERFDGPRRTG